MNGISVRLRRASTEYSAITTLSLGQLRNDCAGKPPEAATLVTEQFWPAGRPATWPNCASRSAVAVPEMRTSLVSGFDMNTRRFACEPVGLFIRLASLWLRRR